jgi:hypothetical protein
VRAAGVLQGWLQQAAVSSGLAAAVTEAAWHGSLARVSGLGAALEWPLLDWLTLLQVDH